MTGARNWRTCLLQASRIIGWSSALGVVALSGWAADRVYDKSRVDKLIGPRERAFIEEVRTCHHRRPRPSWADCEREVRARE